MGASVCFSMRFEANERSFELESYVDHDLTENYTENFT